jgi:hypothetical protein
VSASLIIIREICFWVPIIKLAKICPCSLPLATSVTGSQSWTAMTGFSEASEMARRSGSYENVECDTDWLWGVAFAQY